jgi:hypothetical protein
MHMRRKTAAIPSAGELLELAESATVRLPRGRAAHVVHVERGTVLVTQEGDLDDHILERGDEIILPVGGLAVAWAFTKAAISLRKASAADSKAPATSRRK